ncbi:MAG: CopG family transcriptional regulator [Acidobacteria bacterium]|nr:CopG family transcriptional regulator [Acidobacteriota bacterium]
MGQFTIYLDDQLEERARREARQQGISVSKWIANRIEAGPRKQWSPEALAELGTWKDFPSLEEIRKNDGEDLPRALFGLEKFSIGANAILQTL